MVNAELNVKTNPYLYLHPHFLGKFQAPPDSWLSLWKKIVFFFECNKYNFFTTLERGFEI
jgi:hypothetical protein